MTKLEKLNKEMEKWTGITCAESTELRKYPGQSRKVLRAMRKAISKESMSFWVSHSLVCTEIGLRAYGSLWSDGSECDGNPKYVIRGSVPTQTRQRKGYTLVVSIDSRDIEI